MSNSNLSLYCLRCNQSHPGVCTKTGSIPPYQDDPFDETGWNSQFWQSLKPDWDQQTLDEREFYNPLASAIFAGLAWHEWREGRGMRDLGLAYKAARRLNRKHWHEWSEGLQ